MTSWRPDRDTLKRPVYLSLVEQISGAVDAGELSDGDRLPPQRMLAQELNIAVQTVSRAYDELSRRGLVAGETGRGTFITLRTHEPPPPYINERGNTIVDLSMLKPVVEQMHLDRLAKALADLATSFPANLSTSFRPNVVFARHRGVAVDWLRRCGLETNARNVILTNGATPAMVVALMTATRSGMTLATEAIGHHTLPALAGNLGLSLRGIPTDIEGMIPEALDKAAAEGEIGALFIMPNPCDPTVSMMSAGRREAIVDVARRHDLTIIENDAWGPLIEKCPPPLAALAPERTLYITSFSKNVVPGLRYGYLVVPERLIPAAGNRHLVTNWMATPLIAELATRWIEDGTALEMVLWQRRALRRRQKIAAETLAGIDYLSHPDALHIWIPLGSHRSEDEVVSLARLHDVAIAPGASFRIEGDPKPAIRVCLGQPSEKELRAALTVLAGILASDPEPVLLTL
ncbi:MocR-like ectoine utilization transcription factor EhuR [Bauldia litoralis]|uniref:DNA-binding transcriptional regulator, MocR family, contains an aminotransferase domain n=1 Tax=Bauldia litoralis TaxID=665467 RepID=A0A1G6B9Z0_9HYPH|nr:PLP-dependent aminotransferase family protein [Bauldia litoralis]SDB17462.1 DNA-binding transcriptional regulator, MocR family, contains an aminotransferase domain [Bauldia litoralis]